MTSSAPSEEDVRDFAQRFWVDKSVTPQERQAFLKRCTESQMELLRELSRQPQAERSEKTRRLKERWYASSSPDELRRELQNYTADEVLIEELVGVASLTGAYLMDSDKLPQVRGWARTLWLTRGEFDLATTLAFGVIEDDFQVRDKGDTN